MSVSHVFMMADIFLSFSLQIPLTLLAMVNTLIRPQVQQNVSVAFPDYYLISILFYFLLAFFGITSCGAVGEILKCDHTNKLTEHELFKVLKTAASPFTINLALRWIKVDRDYLIS